MKDFKTASPDRYALLKEFARENRKNATLAEQVLWEHIRKKALGVQFVRQHIISDFIADFAASDIGLIIEVDGGYHAEQKQVEDDGKRTEELGSLGYDVIRFTNEDILFDIDNVIEQLEKIIERYE
ncbi:MAG: endonuclease domain-containing protein [Bacteroidaceae bacterium]|nr:endonuclease domain-containing protein [Bacteroidaceae bacterium]